MSLMVVPPKNPGKGLAENGRNRFYSCFCFEVSAQQQYLAASGIFYIIFNFSHRLISDCFLADMSSLQL